MPPEEEDDEVEEESGGELRFAGLFPGPELLLPAPREAAAIDADVISTSLSDSDEELSLSSSGDVRFCPSTDFNSSRA